MQAPVEKPKGPAHLWCPAWQKPMSKVCQTCVKWVMLTVHSPDGTPDKTEWECVDVWKVILQAEAVQQSVAAVKAARSNAAATESFRNEVVRRADESASYRRAKRLGYVQTNAPLLIEGD